MQPSLQNAPDLGGVVIDRTSETTPTTAVADATHNPSRLADTRAALSVMSPTPRARRRTPGDPPDPADHGNTARPSGPPRRGRRRSRPPARPREPPGQRTVPWSRAPEVHPHPTRAGSAPSRPRRRVTPDSGSHPSAPGSPARRAGAPFGDLPR